MTVSYGDNFMKILFLWRGSIYKAMFPELPIFLVLWYLLYAVNHLALDDEGKTFMTGLIIKFRTGADKLPLQFLLGFFVSNVVGRWWSQAQLLEQCYPDRIVSRLVALFEKQDKHKVVAYLYLLSHKLFRWLNLECVLAWRQVSARIKMRFPTDQHLVDSGLMTESELRLYAKTPGGFGKWNLPAIWSANLLKKWEHTIVNSFAYQGIVAEYINYETNMRTLLSYDWLKLPILYAQVCTFAVYAYMFLIILGSQPKLDPQYSGKIDEIHLPFPLFHTLELIFYIAWLKVATNLSTPYGDDDDDFEMNYLVDRNLYTTYDTMDHLYLVSPADHSEMEVPKEGQPHLTLTPLPHTQVSAEIPEEPTPIHTDEIRLRKSAAKIVPHPRQADYCGMDNAAFAASP